MPESCDFKSHQAEIWKYHTSQQLFPPFLCILSMPVTTLSRKANSFYAFHCFSGAINFLLVLHSISAVKFWSSLIFPTVIILMIHWRTAVCLRISSMKVQFFRLSCIGVSSQWQVILYPISHRPQTGEIQYPLMQWNQWKPRDRTWGSI